ncbi:MAG: bifunctional riboflavin kinase/FAD synthetase [Lachnospiraceae bacterium]|nr:bifunctional riboflavin kinase/FAD synthetase [Lachnospiraceae bacterium]
MKYINSDDFKLNNTVVTLGKFDGFHIGHMRLIEELKKNKNEFNTVVFTFDTSPLKVLGSDNNEILSKNERMNMYEKLEMDVVIEYPFDDKLMHMSPEEFVENVIKAKLNAKKIIVGKDFRFGHKRAGDIELLKKLSKIHNYELVVIDKVKYLCEDVSSTRIKSEINTGNIETANEMLGYIYPICSKVISGKKIGRTLGFPTINQEVPFGKVIPLNGVYASKILIDDKVYTGVTNIGCKPTLKNNNDINVETYIFDFDEDVYEKTVCTMLYSYIRSERQFENLEMLKEQIAKDKDTVKEFFEK